MSKKNSESCISILFKMTILLTILSIVVVTGIFFAYKKLNEFFNRGGNIVVPDFRGKHIVEVFKTKPQGLDVVRRDEKFDNKYPKDHVIAQYPEPGAIVKRGKQIQLSISLGMQSVIVPDLKGNNMREVDLALLNSQLVAGNRAYMYSNEVPVDKIVAQSPMPSEEYGVKQPVDLLISLGKKPETLLLPDLTNSTLDEAKGRLKAWGLNFGRIYSKKDPGRPRFQVISTSPGPYSKVKKGEVVSLLISAGDDEGTATPADIAKFSIHNRSVVKRIVEQQPSIDVQAPPRILIAQDEKPSQGSVPAGDSGRVAAEKEISFVMPDGFMPKEVKFIHITNEGRTQIYAGTHKPLDLVKVKVPAIQGTKVQIYINDVPIEERRID